MNHDVAANVGAHRKRVGFPFEDMPVFRDPFGLFGRTENRGSYNFFTKDCVAVCASFAAPSEDSFSIDGVILHITRNNMAAATTITAAIKLFLLNPKNVAAATGILAVNDVAAILLIDKTSIAAVIAATMLFLLGTKRMDSVTLTARNDITILEAKSNMAGNTTNANAFIRIFIARPVFAVVT